MADETKKQKKPPRSRVLCLESNGKMADRLSPASLDGLQIESSSEAQILKATSEETIAAVIIHWSGQGCNGHNFIESFRSNLSHRSIPIYAFMSGVSEAEKLFVEELGIFQFPVSLNKPNGFEALASDIELRVLNLGLQTQLENRFEKAASDGDLAAARKAIDSMLFVDERSQVYMLMLGILYEKKGDTAAAEETYRKILAAKPDYVKALAALSRVLANRNERDESKKVADLAELISGDFLEVQLTSGKITVDESSEKSISQDLMSQVGSDENAKQYYLSRADNLQKLGKPGEREKFLGRIIETSKSETIKGSITGILDQSEIASGLEDLEKLDTEPFENEIEEGSLQLELDVPAPAEKPLSSVDGGALSMKPNEPIDKNSDESSRVPDSYISKSCKSLDYESIYSKPLAEKKKVDRNLRLKILPPMDNKKPREILRQIKANADSYTSNDLYNPKFDTVSVGRFAIFSTEDRRSTSLRQMLNRLKCKSATIFRQPSKLIQSYYTSNFDGIIVCYESGQLETIELVKTLSCARDTYRVPLTVLCSNQISVDSFLESRNELLFELVDTVPKKEDELASQIDKSYENHCSLSRPEGIITQIRKAMVDFRRGADYNSINKKTIGNLLNQLEVIENQQFWHKLESVPFQLFEEKFSEVEEILDELEIENPASFQLQMFRAELTLANGDAQSAGSELFSCFFHGTSINEYNIGKVGEFLERSGRTGLLQKVIDLWSSKSELESTSIFYKLAAAYSLMIEDKKYGVAFLLRAALNDPTNFKIVSAYAAFASANGDDKLARDMFEAAGALKGADLRVCELGTIQALIRLGESDEAAKRSEKLSNEHSQFFSAYLSQKTLAKPA